MSEDDDTDVGSQLTHQQMAEQSVKLMEGLRVNSINEGLKVIDYAMTHMVSVIRWNQMELAILRDMEDLIRNNSDNEYREGEAGYLLLLDDFREQLRKQQQSELDKLDRAEGNDHQESLTEDTNVGSKH